MSRTNKPIDADTLWKIKGTRYLWCEERQNMIPFLACVKNCQGKCRRFKTYIDIGGFDYE